MTSPVTAEQRRKYNTKYLNTPNGWASAKLSSLKRLAKKQKVPFDLTREDIEMPTTCPELGIALVYQAGHTSKDSTGRRTTDNTPVYYRKDYKKGFTKGNMGVMSAKAYLEKHPNSNCFFLNRNYKKHTPTSSPCTIDEVNKFLSIRPVVEQNDTL